MDDETVKKEMDELERSWFAAHRAASAAQQELSNRSRAKIRASIFWGVLGSALAARLIRAAMRRSRKTELQAAQAQLEEANRLKREIMREIQDLEDSLVA
jgi:hypothetical protein